MQSNIIMTVTLVIVVSKEKAKGDAMAKFQRYMTSRGEDDRMAGGGTRWHGPLSTPVRFCFTIIPDKLSGRNYPVVWMG